MESRVIEAQEVIKRAREEIEKKAGKTPEQLYEEKEKRITDVIHLKIPDRMPVYLRLGDFPVRYAGLSPSAVFYDPAAYQKALIRTLLDFEPDFFAQRYASFASGPALGILGSNLEKWPGGNLRPDQNQQFVEREIMKENEYDLFITDPSDYIIRYYLPRAFAALAPLSKLPPLRSLAGSTNLPGQSARLSTPEIVQAFQAIFQAGEEQRTFEPWNRPIHRDMGIPPNTYAGGGVITPFDYITDHLRGMRGISVDMYKQPEKLFAAMDRILEWNLARMVSADPKGWGRRRVGGGMSHWGSQAMLSRKQFYTFYWPGLKKSLLAAIDMGYIPVPYPEGYHDDRIECMLELPKGKVLVHTNLTNDIFRMKEILGGHVAFMGGVPPALLHFGSPQEVDECCKKLIEVCGKGGGYILTAAAVGEDEAKPENLKAMVDAVRKYGRYE